MPSFAPPSFWSGQIHHMLKVCTYCKSFILICSQLLIPARKLTEMPTFAPPSFWLGHIHHMLKVRIFCKSIILICSNLLDPARKLTEMFSWKALIREWVSEAIFSFDLHFKGQKGQKYSKLNNHWEKFSGLLLLGTFFNTMKGFFIVFTLYISCISSNYLNRRSGWILWTNLSSYGNWNYIQLLPLSLHCLQTWPTFTFFYPFTVERWNYSHKMSQN